MRWQFVHLVLFLIAGGFALSGLPAWGAPFVPLAWQQEVTTIGPLVGERKHLNWIRDLDQDFVDDRFAELATTDKTQVIVQLSRCLERAEVIANLGGYGTVSDVGVLAGYAVLEDVPVVLLQTLALEPGVAAVEFPTEMKIFLDTSTRSTRTRASTTYSPNTFEESFGFDGTGIDIAVMDSGVDDIVHNGLPLNVSGYNAITTTAGDPNDDNFCAGSGADGIIDTAAAGDDIQVRPVGNGALPSTPGFFFICAQPGPNGLRDTVLIGDDLPGGQSVLTGNDGICNSPVLGDDVVVIPVGQGVANGCGVRVGVNGSSDSPLGNDDALANTFHGTHVAGIALGRGVGAGCSAADDGSVPNDCQGMAPAAGLVDVKAADDLGTLQTADILDAIDWVWQDGNAEIVNMSFGSSANSDGTSAVSQSINALVANNIAVAVAAGNSGTNALGNTASASLAITVANADDLNTVDRTDDVIAATSSFGPRVDFNAANLFVGMLKPDITAPGTNIVSTLGDTANAYHSLTGTSMASPHVAGAMALLLDMRADLPPGAMKDLLKRTAFVTPAHNAAGASFPGVDPIYNTRWGFGLLDLFAAGQALQSGITDLSFPNCIGAHPNYPTVRRCQLGGGAASWANSADITLATDPPVQGDPNSITVQVENRTGSGAQNVVVCIEVKELGVGVGEFYEVGCREVTLLGGMASTNVNIPWTPSFDDHQCIQATIDYGFDSQFANNATQRNVSPVFIASPGKSSFHVQNPLNEAATLTYDIRGDSRLGMEFLNTLPQSLGPENCPQLVDVEFYPVPGLTPGTVIPIEIRATATSDSYPQGVELSGVQFNVTVVDPGIKRNYTIARHGQQDLRLPLPSQSHATSDPRREVTQIRAVFNVPLQPADGQLDPADVYISSASASPIPAYSVSFPDGSNVGTELAIVFEEPLDNLDIYNFGFDLFVDLDGDPLTGVPSFELRVLQGDADDTGSVDNDDVVYVRDRINEELSNSQVAGADPNLTGSITGTDISFVRSRIGSASP